MILERLWDRVVAPILQVVLTPESNVRVTEKSIKWKVPPVSPYILANSTASNRD